MKSAQRFSFTLALAPLALSAIACEDIDSEDVKTSGIHATIEARSGVAGSAEVAVTLRAGGPGSTTFLRLTGKDRLLVRLGDEEIDLDNSELIDVNLPRYVADVDAGDEDEIVVAFQRTADESAPESKVKLPAAFSVAAPAQDAELSRAEAITIEVSRAAADGEKLVAEVSGDCLEGKAFEFPAGADSLRIDGGALLTSDGDDDDTDPDTSARCDARIEVRAERVGDLDPAYGEGGTITGIASRSIALRTVP